MTEFESSLADARQQCAGEEPERVPLAALASRRGGGVSSSRARVMARSVPAGRRVLTATGGFQSSV